jgi:hypothetical protein
MHPRVPCCLDACYWSLLNSFTRQARRRAAPAGPGGADGGLGDGLGQLVEAGVGEGLQCDEEEPLGAAAGACVAGAACVVAGAALQLLPVWLARGEWGGSGGAGASGTVGLSTFALAVMDSDWPEVGFEPFRGAFLRSARFYVPVRGGPSYRLTRQIWCDPPDGEGFGSSLALLCRIWSVVVPETTGDPLGGLEPPDCERCGPCCSHAAEDGRVLLWHGSAVSDLGRWRPRSHG